MINLEEKQFIVDYIVKYFLNNGAKISYDLLNDLFTNNILNNELITAAILTAATTIVHNIPVKNKETGRYGLRPYEKCYNGLYTFWQANQQEKFIVELTTKNSLVDLVSGNVLPKLRFLNTNHEFLEPGFGEDIPDLIDIKTNLTYEVKANYNKNNSVSGLHKANVLLDCDGTHLVGYHVFRNTADFRTVLYRFPNILPEFNPQHAVSDEILELIKSGELIAEIEKRLANEGFAWNP